MTTAAAASFDDLDLSAPIRKALSDTGYETPSPIQAETIPLLLAGKDVLGQAQTGTGKTAAFAIPVLSRLDPAIKTPQTLVLAPTRELAIQVAEAFKTYATHLKKFSVLPIYGGQDYRTQLRALERGVQVVVGTPGRVMDHIRRGTLKLDNLQTLVLDEADEMLRMGFIDDVEWVLEQTPPTRQIALFSATMPSQIRRIANKHLTDPEHVTIKVRTTTAETIRQRYWQVTGTHKLDTLTRILEAEPFDAMLVFVRTKTATLELAEKLEARGYAAAALNGDIAQAQRERTVKQLKAGKLDILVATDVAARGLDVERISHVINYDVPHDTESYVHRIGRTGRAGRSGEAILFVAPRERRMLGAIEKATRSKIELMELPSTDMINERRIDRFKQKITDTLENVDLNLFAKLVEDYQNETGADATRVAAALAQLAQGDTPFLLSKKPQKEVLSRPERGAREPRDSRGGKPRDRRDTRGAGFDTGGDAPEKGLVRYRLEVGHGDKVGPGNIVGAIANEAGIESVNIGRISIFDAHSFVDLPEGMPREVLRKLKKVWVSGKQMRISKLEEKPRKKPKDKATARPDSKFNGKPGTKPAGKTGKAGKKKKYVAKGKTYAGKKPKKPKKPGDSV